MDTEAPEPRKTDDKPTKPHVRSAGGLPSLGSPSPRDTRILLVLNEPPWPPNSGGVQRSNLLFRALASIGHVDVMLVTRMRIDDEQSAKLESEFNVVAAVSPLQRGEHGLWRIFRPLWPRLVDRLAHNLGRRSVDYRPDPQASPVLQDLVSSHKYDVVVGRGLKWTARSGALDHGSVILDVDDLDYDVYETRLRMHGQPRWKRVIIYRHLSQLRTVVPPLFDRCAALWVTNAKDLEELGKDRARILPNIPYSAVNTESEPLPPPSPDNQVVLFVGSMFFRPNVDAIDLFVASAWPQVRRQVPGATFRIVGKNLTEEQAGRWGQVPGVEPIGFVEDLEKEYKLCALTVVPIYEGGGTKIKVLESLLFGRSCVVTQHSLRGYEQALRHQEDLWVAETEDELVEGLIVLLTSPDVRNNIAISGHLSVKSNFSFERFAAVVERTVAETIEA